MEISESLKEQCMEYTADETDIFTNLMKMRLSIRYVFVTSLKCRNIYVGFRTHGENFSNICIYVCLYLKEFSS